MSRPAAKATQLIDNQQIRVTRFDFEPGDETGWDTHGLDYTVTTLTGCDMLLETIEDTQVVKTEKGTCDFRKSGVTHNVVNNGDAFMSFAELELKK